jgi:Fe/S biogenesis protein NfuA
MSDTETTVETTSDTDAGGHDDVIVTVTPAALERIGEVRAGEDDADSLVLRIAVTGINGVEYAYDLSFEDKTDAVDGDVTYLVEDLPVVIPGDSVDKLRGATLDLPAAAAQGGLVIRNPNRPNPMAGANLELTGDLADKVQQLLAEAINPSLASHGGFASLVGVEDTKVFLSMGGGCQGCALSAATLREGIQVAIREAIPEVTDIIDVTDHDAGESPFYT